LIGSGTRTSILKFSVISSSFIIRVSPIVPTFWSDNIGEFAGVEDYLGLRPPQASQVDGTWFYLSKNLTISEDIARLRFLLGGGCRDVAGAFAFDLAIIKNGGRSAKDKIYRTFYVAVFVILPTLDAVGVERVLKAKKAAILKLHFVAIHAHGRGLTYNKAIKKTSVFISLVDFFDYSSIVTITRW
jgi:hypothetical protein